jgi:hypothetical protein
MDSEHVWRLAFLDEVAEGDVVRTTDARGGEVREVVWEVTGRRYDPMSGDVSLIGLDGDRRPRSWRTHGHTPILRREDAPPAEVSPEPLADVEAAARQTEWYELSNHLGHDHGRPDLISSSTESMHAGHDALHDTINADCAAGHVHEQEPADAAARLREADLDGEDTPEQPSLDDAEVTS